MPHLSALQETFLKACRVNIMHMYAVQNDDLAIYEENSSMLQNKDP